jgi:hypothetical protein
MPRCPAYNCAGGDANRVRKVTNPTALKIPDEILAAVVDKEQIYRCSYCKFIWYEWTAKDVRAGVMKQSIGFFDLPSKPGEFFPRPDYRLRDEAAAQGPRKRLPAKQGRKRGGGPRRSGR